MFQSWTRDQHDHQFATQENRFIVLLRRRMSVHQESTTPRKLPGKISQSSHYTARDVAQRRQPCIVERKWGRKQLWRCPLLLQFHIRRRCVRCGRLFEINGVVESDYCSQQRRRVGIWLEEEEEDLLECTCTTITDRLAGPNQFTWWCLTLDAWCLTRLCSCMKRVPCNGYSEGFQTNGGIICAPSIHHVTWVQEYTLHLHLQLRHIKSHIKSLTKIMQYRYIYRVRLCGT